MYFPFPNQDEQLDELYQGTRTFSLTLPFKNKNKTATVNSEILTMLKFIINSTDKIQLEKKQIRAQQSNNQDAS